MTMSFLVLSNTPYLIVTRDSLSEAVVAAGLIDRVADEPTYCAVVERRASGAFEYHGVVSPDGRLIWQSHAVTSLRALRRAEAAILAGAVSP